MTSRSPSVTARYRGEAARTPFNLGLRRLTIAGWKPALRILLFWKLIVLEACAVVWSD
jgi:hypothetical protein